jgi:hypothetical protein
MAIDTDEVLKQLVLPQYLELAIEIVSDIDTKIVKPIVESRYEEILSAFQSKLVPFSLKLSNLNRIILLSQKDMLRVAESDSKLYDKILEVIRQRDPQIGSKNTAKLIEITERMIDYENVLLGILMNRPAQLTEALKQIDVEELMNSIAAALLALACIVVILKHEKPDLKKFEILLHVADESSEVMESYSDTIDILSNPEEMELLKQSEQG